MKPLAFFKWHHPPVGVDSADKSGPGGEPEEGGRGLHASIWETVEAGEEGAARCGATFADSWARYLCDN